MKAPRARYMQCFLELANLTKQVDASYSAFMANDIEFWVDPI